MKNEIELAMETGNVELLKKYSDSALILACAMGRLDMVKFLIELGANIHNGHALGRACNRGAVDVVEFILDSFDIKNLSDTMSEACTGDQVVMVDYLASRGIEIDSRAIINAVINNKTKVLSHILRGYDVRDCLPPVIEYISEDAGISTRIYEILILEYNASTEHVLGGTELFKSMVEKKREHDTLTAELPNKNSEQIFKL